MAVKSIKQPVLDYLASLKPELQKEGITKLGLFGSLAKNQATIYSDIDVLIKTTRKFWDRYPEFDCISFLDDLRLKISDKFKKEVDICDISGIRSKATKANILKGAIYV